MKRESRLLLAKASDALVLAIEHFNRPSDRGRPQTVLILLDHAFEMLLKAAIIHNGGRIRQKNEKNTIGFDACLRKGLSDARLKFLDANQVLTLQALNGLRDAAQHHLLDICEENLYIQAQAAVTLFRDLLRAVFGEELAERLPARVLPLSTVAPKDLAAVFSSEVDEVRRLLRPGSRRRVEAQAKLRTLAILDGALQGERLQPGDSDLRALGERIGSGDDWTEVFPGVAALDLSSNGYGPSLDLRITKKEGVPVQLVAEGTPGASVVAIRRVDELGFYNLGHKDLVEQLDQSGPMVTAFIRHLGIEDDPDCAKVFFIGKSKFKRYSTKALSRLREALKTEDMEEVWRDHAPKAKKVAPARKPGPASVVPPPPAKSGAA